MNRLLVVPKKTSRTPEDAWVGPPGLFHRDIELVEISCVFTWDKDYCEELRHQWEPRAKKVAVGGPAYDDVGGEFEPGRYVKRGIVHTSRGCLRRCPWCYVWKREGKIRELEVKEGNIIEDSNLLACSRQHIEKVFEMLKAQKKIEFAGGIDARLLREWHIDAIGGLNVHQLFLAYDHKSQKQSALSAISRLGRVLNHPNKIRCYVMVGRNETMGEAEERLREVWDAGGLPFAQVYDKLDDRDRKWARFARVWQRPAAMRSMMRDGTRTNRGDK